MNERSEQLLTGMVREQYIIEWIFLGVLWIISITCAGILTTRLLMLPTLGPPWTPTPEQTWWEWFMLAMQHPVIWTATTATTIALILTISVTIYFAIWIPSRVDQTIQLELHRIGSTTKLRLRRQYLTQINSKGLLVTKLLPKTTGSGEYGLVVLRATFPQASPSELDSVSQRYLLAFDANTLATVSSVDELHFKITQLARAFAEL
ncbi:hypothetical protein E2P64_06280 [Candidatus Bathyarchaeota archaeon]|nr:hypothetical protein E2P64_06280 [Candidatus Bathyarchaeota archaeon]